MPQDSGLMPPHNPAAESPQDVYDINDSIHTCPSYVIASRAAVLDSLDSWLQLYHSQN